MKRLFKWITESLFPSKSGVKVFSVGDPYIEFKVTFTSRLTSEQMGLMMHKSIDNFSPNCKPIRLTLNTEVAIFTFSNGCMSGNTLIGIVNRTLMGTTPKVEVSSVSVM